MGGSTQQGRAGGTVTFLFSDIEGSTALLREFGDRYGTLVADHHELLRQAFQTHGGVVVDTEGDGAFVAFTQARNAVAAALDAQLALSRHSWPGGAAVRVRMGLHAGDALWSGDGYVGMAVHRAARVCGAAHGRQVLLSELTRHLVLDALPEGAWLLDLGTHRLRDFDEPQHVYQLCHDDLHSSFPPIRSLEATASRQRVVMATPANEGPRGESVMTRLLLKAAEQDGTSLLSDETTWYLTLPDAARALQCAVRYLGHLQRRERAGGFAAPGARVSIAALGPSGQSGAARIAKRLCVQARAGEILVSPEVAAALRAVLGEDTPPLTPRGSPEGGLPGISVEWTVPPPPPLPPALSLDATAFVGRERELTMLQSAWARAEDGDFQLVFVAGEPGIGKTRLASELARVAYSKGATVLYGRCDPDLELAFQPFAEALDIYVAQQGADRLNARVETWAPDLSRIVPSLARRLPGPQRVTVDPETDRLRLYQAVTAVLADASEDNPILLVLEDLHWAGRPTLQMLGHVARNVGRAPLMIVATFRDTDVSDRHPIAALVGELHRGQDVARLDLGGLDERAVSALVEGSVASQLGSTRRIQLTQTLRRHTAGNPFFLVQVLSHLTETRSLDSGGVGSDLDHPDATDVPDVVRDAVEARLSRLSDVANSVLATGSVVGSEFDLRILQHLAGTRDSDQLLNGLDEAVTARLLLEAPAAPGRYSFAHALVRGAVYTGLTVGRRALLHRQVGEALEALGRSSDATVLPVLAYHFAQGAPTGSGNKAGTYALAAARQALSQLGFEEAASYVERGLRALETDGDQPDYGLRAKLLLTLAEAKAHALDHPARKRAALLAAEAARAAGTAGDLAWAAFWYSARPVAGVRDDTGIDLCQEALAALAPDRLDLRAIVLAILASQRSFGGEGYAADQVSSEALALARKSGDAKALALALFARYDTLWGTENAAERVRLAEELLATDAVTHAVAWTDGRRLRALARLQLGDIEGCRADVENLDRLARERRSRYLRAVVAQWHGVLAMLEGRFAEVEETAAEIPTLAGEDQNLRNVFAAQMFHLRLEQGRLAEFQPLLRAFVEANPGMPGFAAALALTHAHLGDIDEAHRLFQGLAHSEFACIPQDLVWPATIGVLSEVCVRLTDSVSADVLYRLLRPFSGQLIVVATGSHCLGAADRYLGMLADVSRELAESEAHFERAVALEERIGAPPLLARTQFWYARMLLRHGRATDQETRNRLLLSARETTERLGMAQLLDDVRVAQR